MWYVVCSDCATDPQPNEPIWTISTDPEEAGWETDAGFPGYGLRKPVADYIAAVLNEHEGNLPRTLPEA